MNMNWQEKTSYATLLVSMAAIVIWWRLGIIALTLFSAVTIIKILTTPRRKEPPSRMLWLLIAYWLLYAISACYSHDRAEGWDTAVVKLFFLILPTLFLLDDTTYLTRRRIGAVFYVLVAAIVARFFICVGISAYDYLHDVPLGTVKDWQYDPLDLHHSYLALYISVAMAFLYSEAVSHYCHHPARWWIVSGLSAAVMLAYIAISRSRSGILALALLAVAGMLHLFFVRKRRILALSIFAAICAACGAAYLANPGLDGIFGRFYALIYTRDLGITQDRTILFQCCWEAACQRPIFGYGSGDVMGILMQSYAQHDFQMGLNHHYDCHNQYMETLLECGLVGLAVLFIMLLAPLVAACRRGSRNLFTVLAIICIATVIFFETMLGRQMGIQFVALTYCLLITSLNVTRD